MLWSPFVDQSKHIVLDGVFTHFSCADDGYPSTTEEQFERIYGSLSIYCRKNLVWFMRRIVQQHYFILSMHLMQFVLESGCMGLHLLNLWREKLPFQLQTIPYR